MNNFKIGLVLQGGGIRGAFTAGVLDAFLDANVSFDVIGGTSAGALQAISFVSKDYGRNLTVLTKLMRGKKFLSIRNLVFKKTIFDFDYLFNVAPYSDCPFSFDTYYSNPTEIISAATSLVDGKATYFRKSDKNFFPGTSASASLPLLSKPFFVDGVPYLDGSSSDPIPLDYISELGCEKIVVVLTRHKGFRKKKRRKSHIKMAKWAYKKYPKYLEAYENEYLVYNKIVDKIDRLSEEGKIFAIYPSEPLNISHTEKDEKKITAVYELGKRIAMEKMDEMKEFLNCDEPKLETKTNNE